jgi:hypothetical protein
MEKDKQDVFATMQSTPQSTLTDHGRDRAVLLFEQSASACMIPSQEESRSEGGGHDVRIVHLTWAVFLMMHGLQQIVTPAEDRYHVVIHGLPPRGLK